MKRLKLCNVYHDARIKKIRWHGTDELVVDVDLCKCCNGHGGRATLWFCGVDKVTEVAIQIESMQNAATSKDFLAEISGISKADDASYCLHLSFAPFEALRIKSKTLLET